MTDPNSACAGFSFDANGNPLVVNGKPEIDLSGLTFDEQFTAGLVCDGVKATVTSGFSQCDAAGLTSKLINIPAPGVEDDDRHPQRIANRNLFDMELGDNNIKHFGGDRFQLAARVTAINVANKYALYNYLSTFSGDALCFPQNGDRRDCAALLKLRHEAALNRCQG